MRQRLLPLLAVLLLALAGPAAAGILVSPWTPLELSGPEQRAMRADCPSVGAHFTIEGLDDRMVLLSVHDDILDCGYALLLDTRAKTAELTVNRAGLVRNLPACRLAPSSSGQVLEGFWPGTRITFLFSAPSGNETAYTFFDDEDGCRYIVTLDGAKGLVRIWATRP